MRNTLGYTLNDDQERAYTEVMESIKARRWVNSNRDEGLRGLYVMATRPTHGLFCV